MRNRNSVSINAESKLYLEIDLSKIQTGIFTLSPDHPDGEFYGFSVLPSVQVHRYNFDCSVRGPVKQYQDFFLSVQKSVIEFPDITISNRNNLQVTIGIILVKSCKSVRLSVI